MGQKPGGECAPRGSGAGRSGHGRPQEPRLPTHKAEVGTAQELSSFQGQEVAAGNQDRVNTLRERGSDGAPISSATRSPGPRWACFLGRRRRTAPTRLQRGRPCRAGAAAALAPVVQCPQLSSSARPSAPAPAPAAWNPSRPGPCAPQGLMNSLLRARPRAVLVLGPAGRVFPVRSLTC